MDIFIGFFFLAFVCTFFGMLLAVFLLMWSDVYKVWKEFKGNKK